MYSTLRNISENTVSPVSAIIYKISETDSSFHVKKLTKGKVLFLFLKSILLVLRTI